MKKSVFTFIALVTILFIGGVTNANAQKVITADPSYSYNQVRDEINKGDAEYRNGAWTTAQTYYEWALRDNGQCTGKKYISDEEINKKLDDCKFAIQHNGQTRSEYNQNQRESAMSNLLGALVNVLSKK